MKTLSIIGIIISILGILISLLIFINLQNFYHSYFELYFDKNDVVYYQIGDLRESYLQIIGETIPPILIVFFSFFLFLSIKLNIKK